MIASRAALAASILACLLGAGTARAEQDVQTPGLVVDASSGRVLFAERATEPWYPASITKLMTTYVALDMVRQGRVAMSTPLTMSEYAASQPPSKLGLKPGGTITLENALKIIMVKSANDLATMIGENLGGSVDGFALMMNERAHRLGMRESRWYNPSGLPDGRQQTSARDMAVLARALLAEFPDYEYLFHIGAVQLGSEIMRNHNGMLGRYPGADGMKTGFICSGGFNIVATATQGGRRIITVVMGYPSARERDLRAADLFDMGFSSRGWGSQQVESLPPSGVMSPPDMRQVICGPKRKRTPREDDEQAVVPSPGAAGNAENPIASLFSSSALGAFSGAAPQLGSRRSLGPRVAFEPIPVFLGASPGSVPDEDAALRGGRRVRIAARPVRTRLIRGRSAVPEQAFTATTPLPGPVVEGGQSVETVRAGKRPASPAALKANLEAKPAAEIKPKPGAIGSGSGEGRRLGAIRAKPAGETVAGTNPEVSGSTKPRTRAAQAKLKAAQAKPKAATAEAATPRAKPASAQE